MTVPLSYETASADFAAFLVETRDRALLETTNQAYTMVDAVFRVFRRRLTVDDALAFADLLPPLLLALFLSDWQPDDRPAPFADRATLTREAQAFRADHNSTPDNAIAVVAAAVRPRVDAREFDALLAALGDHAVEFWRPLPPT